jgi:glycosyltransferase involved in cell wall biosynthesis
VADADATTPPLAGPILLVIRDLAIGGTERHLALLAPRLADRGFRPVVYTLTPEAGLADALETAGVRVLRGWLAGELRWLPSSIRWAVVGPLAAARLWRLMRRERPAIVHFFLPAAYLVGGLCALLAGQRVRVMSRRSLRRYQQGHPGLARLEQWLHRRMTAVLGNSRAVVAELRAEGVPPARLGLIYNGIDLEAFEALPSRDATRARLGIPDGALVLTTVANLIPYKGHADLLEALARAVTDLPARWQLLCVGRDDGIGAALASRAAALGLAAHVRWLGERGDVPGILAASDIGVLASHQEGFSNSLLEAMAAGLPVIATEVGGNAEAVTHGATGLLVPPHDPAALARAVVELARDPARRCALGDAGRVRVAERFSIEACVSRYEQLYRHLATGPSRPLDELLG